MKPSFHFLTLFPEVISAWLETSIMGRALKAGLFEYHCHQLRDFSPHKHRSVDDVAFGGGGGMVLRVDVLANAVENIKNSFNTGTSEVICFTPGGALLNQSLCTPSSTQHHILVCGHYEGIDQRFIEGWVDRCISLGDFVISGGELPALVYADAHIRQIEGTLGNPLGPRQES